MMRTITAALAAGVIGVTLLSGVADASQKSKNNWRNATIGGAAVTGYGLVTHNKTVTAVGAAATGYSAYRYEQDRHHQSQESAARKRYYRHHHHRHHHH